MVGERSMDPQVGQPALALAPQPGPLGPPWPPGDRPAATCTTWRADGFCLEVNRAVGFQVVGFPTKNESGLSRMGPQN